jgi:hypothetical protein
MFPKIEIMRTRIKSAELALNHAFAETSVRSIQETLRLALSARRQRWFTLVASSIGDSETHERVTYGIESILKALPLIGEFGLSRA